MAFRAKLRHRWRSWLAMAVLVSVVGGLVLAAIAAGRRTEAAFPQFVAAHGFDSDEYATRPVPKVAELPGVTSATELVSPYSGQPTCACTHPINPTDFGVIYSPPARRSPFKLVSGRMPDPSSPDQVLASFTLQQDYGVHLGSVIRVPFYAPSQASAYNDATGAEPKPKGPTVDLHVVGFEASEFEFPSGTTPSYDLFTTAAFARTVIPRTSAGYVYLVRLRDGAGCHLPIQRGSALLERRRTTGWSGRGRGGSRHRRRLYPPPGHRVVDPRHPGRARRSGGRGPGPGPPEQGRERGLPDHGRPRRRSASAGGARHGPDPGGGACRRRRRGGRGHPALADRPPRRGAHRRELDGVRLRCARCSCSVASPRWPWCSSWACGPPCGRRSHGGPTTT